MRPTRIVLLAAVALLAAGCAAPDESRDRPDTPEDATTGDAGGPEVSGRVTVVEGNGTSNGTAPANQTAEGKMTSGDG